MGLPGTALRMWALDAPMTTVDKSMLVVGGSGTHRAPMPTYLIEHPRGLVLYDTGLDPRAALDAVDVYGPLAEHIHLEFTPEQRLDRQIRALGYEVEDVRHVVLSHLHFDHAGGMSTFPQAQFWVGEGEMPYALWPDPLQAGYYRQEDLLAALSFRWMEVPGLDHDMFGDGSVTLVPTPGHTPGHLAMVVRLPGRNFVLTGDAAHHKDALTTLMPKPGDCDAHEAVRSLRRLKLLEASADATVWVAHDGDDWVGLGAPRCFD